MFNQTDHAGSFVNPTGGFPLRRESSHKVRSIALLVLCTLLANGCQQNDSGGGDVVRSDETARIRVAHAVSTAPTFDVCWAGEVVIRGVTFGQISEYASVPASTSIVFGVAPGGTCDEQITATGSATVVFDQDYTFTIFGAEAPVQTLDDNSAPAAGQARLRLINGSPDSEGLDAGSIGDGVFLAKSEYLDQRDYQTYAQVEAKTYNLAVVTSGIPLETGFLVGESDLDDGHVYTLFATGLVFGGTPELGVVLVDDAGPSTE